MLCVLLMVDGLPLVVGCLPGVGCAVGARVLVVRAAGVLGVVLAGHGWLLGLAGRFGERDECRVVRS